MMNTMKTTTWMLAAVIACFCFACGCNKAANISYPTVKVAGTVKVNGVSIEQGRLRFSPTEPNQAPAADAAISDGKYAADNAPVGNVVAILIGTRKTGRQIELYGKQIDQTINIIPAKYSRGIPVTLDANGNGNRDFDLTSN